MSFAIKQPAAAPNVIGHWAARWRGRDYSWSGLAAKAWRGWAVAPDGRVMESADAPEGSRPATLQDYWRDEEVCLIEGDGVRWTRAHCPTQWRDGSPSPKAQWGEPERAAFAALLSTKLGEAGQTAFEGANLLRDFVGVDRRAQFHGCVFFGAPVHPDPPIGPYSVRFEGALFTENVRFNSAAFVGDAVFTNAVFGAEANFTRASFKGEASFHGAQFAKSATFDGADFGGEAGFEHAGFHRGARFESATFQEGARFEHLQVEEYTGFDNTIFAKMARFDNARLTNSHFNRAKFEADARFEGAAFSGELDFRHTTFMRPALFVGAKVPAQAALFSAAFRGARFADVADFTGAGTHFIAAFDAVMIERKLLLDTPGESAAEWEFVRMILPGLVGSYEKSSRQGRGAYEQLLKELEGGCRAIKVAMGRDRDEAMEQRYYRFQLIARRKQKGTPVAEKLYSWLYATFSDYGMGLWQPFATLLALTLGFGALYWGWGEGLRGWPHGFSPIPNGAIDQEAWDALLLSANNVFRPFGVWSSEFHTSFGAGWVKDFLSAFDAPNEGGQRLAIRLTATLQSILAVVLFFLFGLAVRRRFQIG